MAPLRTRSVSLSRGDSPWGSTIPVIRTTVIGSQVWTGDHSVAVLFGPRRRNFCELFGAYLAVPSNRSDSHIALRRPFFVHDVPGRKGRMPPSPSIHATLHELATRFANELAAALIGASLDDLRSESSRSAPRPVGRPRSRQTSPARTPRGDRSEILGRVLDLLRAHPKGMRAEDIRRRLRLEKPLFVRAANDGLATGEIHKEGRLRATTYFAAE